MYPSSDAKEKERGKVAVKTYPPIIVMQMWRDKASLYPSSDAQVFVPFVAPPPKGGCQGGQDGGPAAAAVAPDFFAKSTREFAILDDSGFLQTFKPPWATDSFGEGREGGRGREKCRRPNLIVKGRGE